MSGELCPWLFTEAAFDGRTNSLCQCLCALLKTPQSCCRLQQHRVGLSRLTRVLQWPLGPQCVLGCCCIVTRLQYGGADLLQREFSRGSIAEGLSAGTWIMQAAHGVYSSRLIV